MTHKPELLVSVGLLAFALLCYASVIPTYFLSDDFSLIGRVAQEGMFCTWGYRRFLRPGTVLSFLIDHRIWDFDPVGYHFTNVVFHALAAYTIYLIGRHLFTRAEIPQPRTLSFLTACLFIALPSHSEPVSWIAGRTDVIAAALGLAATACFLFLLESPSLVHATLSLMLLVPALLTKESVIVLPAIWCMLFVHHWWSRRERPSSRSIVVLALICPLLAGYFLLRKAILGHFVGGYGAARHIFIMQASSVANLIRYGIRSFLPALPPSLYSLGSVSLYVALGAAAALLITLLCFRWKQIRVARWKLFALFLVCYFISLVPVITMRVHLFDTQGERFLYLPSAFGCLAIAYIVAVFLPKRRHQVLVLLCLIALQAVALQWVNKRWVTASILCEQIAREVSEADPATTVVLNVPDNYRGAYVFRNGLQQAATVFVGGKSSLTYRQISDHTLDSLDQVIEATFNGSNIVLNLPEGLHFRRVREEGFRLTRKGNSLLVSDPEVKGTDVLTILSFATGNSRPMLRTIEWKLRDDRRGREPL